MKRILCIVLTVCILLSAASCKLTKAEIKDPVSFYYRRTDMQYHSSENVIVAEEREIAGHTGDIHYVLSLYLLGPLDEKLSSPFPKGTRLFGMTNRDNHLELILSDMDETLDEIQFTLASACLALTCLEFTGCDQVTIKSGQRNITLNSDSLLLYDTVIQTPSITEEPQ